MGILVPADTFMDFSVLVHILIFDLLHIEKSVATLYIISFMNNEC